jgi:hypothetical protein
MSKGRKILGYISLLTGAVCTFVFLSPLFPIGIEAFFVGGVFFALGLWALAGKGISAFFHTTARVAKAARNAKQEREVKIDPLLPVRILKLARQKEGRLTVSEVAISLNVPIDQAEEGLKACVRTGNAVADYDIPHGYTLYSFPEFQPPENGPLLS